MAIGSAFGVIRDGGVDPANLGKGGWILYPIADPDATFSAMKSQGFNYVIVKAGTATMLWTGSWLTYVPPSDPAGAMFTRALVQKAHNYGLKIFGSNRSGGDKNPDTTPFTIDVNEINGEIEVADYVFNQGADGFIWDAEIQWESRNAGLGTNGPAMAWLLCSTVRSHWPTKFLALNPADTIYLHSSFPFKEFAYWSDCTIPMVYHHAESQGNAFAAIHWMDVHYRRWQNEITNLSSTINGQTIYWSNSIKPLVLMRDVYNTFPDEDVMNFLDYLIADPNCVTAGGYRGFNGYRSELYSAGQLANIQAGTVGDVPNVVNNIVIDDAKASKLGSWTMVKTIDATTATSGEKVIFSGATGTDTNSFGTNYFCKGRGNGSAWLRFRPKIIVPGDYNLYEWHPDRPDASTNVPHIIIGASGSTNVYVDQTVNAGKWNLLGRFTFVAGTNGNITITDSIPENNALAMADGLKLVYVSTSPVIMEQPQSRTNAYGTDASFSVVAAGKPPLSYQWRFNTANINGATASSYARTNVHSGDIGSYSVVVTNIYGRATSSNATLTVLAPNPPHIDAINLLSGGQIRLQISGSPGQYGIDGAATLTGWSELTNFITGTNRFEYTDPQTDPARRFYRARLIW